MSVQKEKDDVVYHYPPFKPANAACLGATETFYGDRSRSGNLRTEYAKQVCKGCPALEACYEYAMNAPRMVVQFGVWAGMTDKQLRVARAKYQQERQEAA